MQSHPNMRIHRFLFIFLASVLSENSASEPNIFHRREQDSCSAPSGGCGYGLWNLHSCNCDCIPPYCFNDIYQSCITPGSCPDPFEGCTPDVDCPYYVDTLNGICKSGSTISQGIYTVYRTIEECCSANYPTDISTCLQITTAPTLSPVQPTASPAPSQAALSQTMSLQPTGSHSKNSYTQGSINLLGVMLAPIPISFTGLSPSKFELNDDRREEMSDVIRATLSASSDELNVTILSIDIMDNVFSLRDSNTLALQLRIEVTGDEVFPKEIHAAFLETLQNQIDDVATALEVVWGSEVFTNSAILSIGDVSTTPRSSNQLGDIGSHGDGGENGVSVWVIVLFSILLALFCGGLAVWQRRRASKDAGGQEAHHNSFFDEEMSFDETRLRQTKSQKHDVSFQQSIHSFSSQSTARMGPLRVLDDDASQLSKSKVKVRVRHMEQSDQSLGDDKTIPRERQMDQTNQSLDRLNRRERDMNSPNPTMQITNDESHNSLRNSSQTTPNIIEENSEEEEDGYDGGKSSSRLDMEHDHESDNSSDENKIVDDGQSEDDGLVLGLLYYDGATSAEESEGRDSGKSRRSRRKNRSMHSGKSSSVSGKSSSGKSKNTRRSRRRKAKPMEKLEEEPKQQRADPEGFRESDLACTVNMPLQGDNLHGSVVYAASSGPTGNLDDYQFRPIHEVRPRGDHSAVSHGSTIRTEDESWKFHSHGSKTFNTAGESGRPDDRPEVKMSRGTKTYGC